MAGGIEVRTATPADAEAVSALLRASYTALLRDAYDPAVLAATLPLMTRANPRLLASGRYYVAEAPDGAAVGSGGWSFERPDTGETEPGLAHLRHFASHPDHAGRGIGRALFAHCAEAARAAGATAMECYATLNGEPFYRALGFERVRGIDVPMGDGIALPSVVMVRAL